MTTAWPMNEADGQPAGLASNCAAVQAFCSVVNRDGSCIGSSTLTFVMFAWLPCGALGSVTLVTRSAPSALLVFPLVETENFGANFRLVQLLTSNGIDTGEATPSVACDRARDRVALQFVGLNVKPLRVMFTFTCWICNGMPSMIVRDRTGRDGERGGDRVDFDLRPYDHRAAFLQVERARLGGVHDRQSERGAVVFFGQVDLAAGDGEWVPTQPHRDDRFADLARFGARPRVRLRLRGRAVRR